MTSPETKETSKTGIFSMIALLMRSYPSRSALMMALLVLAGLAEGVGVASLLPLLEMVINKEGGSPTALEEAVNGLFGFFGITPTLPLLLGIIVVGILLKNLFTLLAMKQVGYTAANIVTEFRLSLLQALFKARWSYFVSQPVGLFTNAISTEAMRISKGYSMGCLLIAGSIQVLFYIALAAMISWQVTAASISAEIVVIFVLNPFVSMAKRAGKRQTDSFQFLISRLTDFLNGMKPIKAMGQVDHVEPFLREESINLRRALQEKVLSSQTLKALQEPAIVLLMSMGIYLLLRYKPGAMASVMLLAFLFARTLTRMAKLQKEFQSLATVESAFWSFRNRLDEAESAGEIVSGTRTPSLDRGVDFDRVSFSYAEREVLHDVSFSIPFGKISVLVGPSGAGKTTIADLLSGLMTPDSGRILIDGVPLQEIHLEAWRHMIGYVPQEMFLFHGNILSNVTLGDERFTREDVEEALRKAGVLEFVASLPQGLETVVGERGGKISGGQRQRLSLARALVRRPRLLILDEVTTALDPATESAVCREIAGLKGEMAILAISHQQAFTEVADVMYRVQNGQVANVKETRSGIRVNA